ncbi:MAG: ECF-type sigma factor [Planctomycetota bacterium]
MSPTPVSLTAEVSKQALEDLVPLVYEELRELALRLLRRERRSHTLQPTALIHEAYLRLATQHAVSWNDRHHFVGIAARAMRQVLINHAEARQAVKRGGAWQRVELDEVVGLFEDRSLDLLELNEALQRLQQFDADLARIVELRFFGGLTVQETARVVGAPVRSVERDWAIARAWLLRELTADGSPVNSRGPLGSDSLAATQGLTARSA